MLPFWYQIAIAVVGLGLPYWLLNRYCKNLGELFKWTISIAILVVLLWGGNVYQKRHATQWPPLTRSQQANLKTVLMRFLPGGNVRITVVDANTLMLGKQLASVFKSAGWPEPNLGGPSIDYVGAIFVGVTLLAKPDDPAASAFYNSIKDSGLDPHSGKLPEDDRKLYEFELFVGSRQ